jgi:parallel beta-helix repeat protein
MNLKGKSLQRSIWKGIEMTSKNLRKFYIFGLLFLTMFSVANPVLAYTENNSYNFSSGKSDTNPETTTQTAIPLVVDSPTAEITTATVTGVPATQTPIFTETAQVSDPTLTSSPESPTITPTKPAATPTPASTNTAEPLTTASTPTAVTPTITFTPTSTKKELSAQAAVQYYVSTSGSDSNPGTQSQPWKTVNKAVSVANPGDVVYLMGGVYAESVKISRAGTASLPITLTNYQGQTVTIDGGSSSALVVNGATPQYWIVDGLRLTSTNSYTIFYNSWGCSGACNGTDHWTFTNNYIGGSVYIYGAYTLFSGNEVDGSVYHGNGNGVEDLYDVSHHNSFVNNYVHDFTSRGIWSMHRTHDDLFENNRVDNISNGATGQCIDMDGFGSVEWRQTVRGNTVSRCSQVGIQFENTFDSTIENNTVSNPGAAGIIIINYGATISSPGDVKCQAGGESNQYGDTDNNNDCEGNITADIIQDNTITNFGSVGGVIIYHAGGIKILQNTIYGGSGKTIFLDSSAFTPQIEQTGNVFTPPSGNPTTTATPITSRTNTPVAPTATKTNTSVAPTATKTNTSVAPTATKTNTPVAPTATKTNTSGAPTATKTNTPVAPIATVIPTNTLLSSPKLLAPSNYGVALTRRPSFEWSAVSDATSYTFQLSTSATFSSLTVNVKVSSPTYTVKSSLSTTKTYYWRVKANGNQSSAWSQTFRFTSANPPATPGLASPTDGSLLTDYQPRLNWNSVANSQNYQVQLATSSSFSSSSLIVNTNVDTVTYLDLPSPLKADGTYYWRVRAFDKSGQYSLWTSYRSIKTAMLPPVLLDPAIDSSAMTTRPTFDWNKLDGASSYHIQISRLSTFRSTIIDKVVTDAFYTPTSDLPRTTRLYWRVSAKGSRPSTWSKVFSFTSADPPLVPVPLNPTNNALTTSNSPIDLLSVNYISTQNWGKVTDADHYELQFSTAKTFTKASIILDVNQISGLSYTINRSLVSNTTFFWRVRSFDAIGQYSNWSSVRYFRTAMLPPELLAPAMNSTLTTIRPVFDWKDVSGASGYVIQVSSKADFSKNLISTSITKSTYTSTINLPRGVTIYWRVYAKGTNPSSWSNRIFTIQ